MITQEHIDTVLAKASSEVSDRIMARINVPDEAVLLSPARAAGLLDVTPATLTKLPIPKVTVMPKLVRYSLADIMNFISDCKS